ncbi:MAG: hypothetical protein ACE5F9_02925 [Phycisphaerae bacterium]
MGLHRLILSTRPAVAATVLVMAMVGCTGSATVQVVSLRPDAIDPPPARVWRYDAGECYWWIDAAENLNVALRSRRHNLLLGRLGDVDLTLSFVLGKPPAGHGRNYAIRSRHTRTLIESALATQHFESYGGIADVIVEDDGMRRGSFRIWVRQRPGFSPLMFLSGQPGNFLVFGSFHAVPDENHKGRYIRQHTESGGWERPTIPRRVPTSQATAAKRTTPTG